MTALAEPVLAPSEWGAGPDGTVPVADVVRSAGVPHGAVDYTIRLGLVPVHAQFGAHRRRYISREDALMLLAAAALAVAAGVALATIVRAIKATGAQVGPGGLTIPVKGIGG
jgi:hypothetical protein